MVTKPLFAGLALAFAGLGLAGAALPGVPTVPFLLVAAACARRGYPDLSHRLESHPRWGSALRQWRRHGAVSVRAKLLATVMMAASFALLVTSGLTWPPLTALAVVFLGVLGWLWSRPSAITLRGKRWAGETAG